MGKYWWVIPVAIVLIAFLLIIMASISIHENNVKTCKLIGDKKTLEYYNMKGCSMYEDCNYKCLFVNSTGDTIEVSVK